jgi:hypothetical protein
MLTFICEEQWWCKHLDASYLFQSTGNLPTTFGRQIFESLHIVITQGCLKYKYFNGCVFNTYVHIYRSKYSLLRKWARF